MKAIKALFLIFSILPISMEAQQMFDKFSGYDVGRPKVSGFYGYDTLNQVFTLTGAGYNLWFARDEFYFVPEEVEGDFIFSANVEFIGKGMDPHRKMGLMIRNSKAEDAVYMDAAVHGDGLTSLQYRREKGSETLEKTAEVKSPGFVQLERKGSTYIFRYSANGQPLVEAGRVELQMGNKVWAGMFVGSHNVDVLEKAKFWNVRIEKPAAADTDGYKKLSPSRLETIDLETGIRRVIYETEDHIEAPNWSRDGSFLVYNSGGKLYRFDLEKGEPEIINTGFATSNNNDHGISFDGKTLAISNHAEGTGGKSIIYTLPIEGGTPKRITEKGPSYWHGWSPDGNWLTYCAERNGNYDVYKIPSGGGTEIRLTSADGLDDGPEYSPDGKYIYFNSTRSGLMQIWRMKPDGTDQEQVTSDRFNNWFAHPSPDGKMLIMISYLPDEVPAASHPHNQRVMLRTVDTATGEIKTVAFLYGGQGTINVPSWSPDSKKVAFVSYTY